MLCIFEFYDHNASGPDLQQGYSCEKESRACVVVYHTSVTNPKPIHARKPSTLWRSDARHPAALWYSSVARYVILDGVRVLHAQDCANLTGSHIDRERLTIMSGWGDILLIKATRHGVIFSSAYQTGCCFTCAGCKRSRGKPGKRGGGRSALGFWRRLWRRIPMQQTETSRSAGRKQPSSVFFCVRRGTLLAWEIDFLRTYQTAMNRVEF